MQHDRRRALARQALVAATARSAWPLSAVGALLFRGFPSGAGSERTHAAASGCEQRRFPELTLGPRNCVTLCVTTPGHSEVTGGDSGV